MRWQPTLESSAWVARLGIVLLGGLVVGFLTGAVLFVGRHVEWSPTIQPFVTALHVYAGVVSVPFVAAKVWGTWPLLNHPPADREAPARDRVASTLLIVSTVVLYASGLLLALNLAPSGNGGLKALHLYSTLTTAAALTWHLAARLVQSWSLARNLTIADRPGGWDARLYSRRAILALAAAVGLSWASRSVFPAKAGEDPNDFPVTNFGLSPQAVDVSTWRLEVSGAVSRPLSLSYSYVLSLPRESHSYPLNCVTGWSATREWMGIPIQRILDLAGPTVPAPLVRFSSATGYTVVLPPQAYTRGGAMLATHVAGVPFTQDHGFPVRLIVPDEIGEHNVKWLAVVEVLND